MTITIFYFARVSTLATLCMPHNLMSPYEYYILKIGLLTKIKIKVIPLHIPHMNRVLKSNVKQKC